MTPSLPSISSKLSEMRKEPRLLLQDHVLDQGSRFTVKTVDTEDTVDTVHIDAVISHLHLSCEGNPIE